MHNAWCIWRGERGDMFSSLDFGVPLTEIESMIPEWDGMPLIPSLERIVSVSQWVITSC